MPDLFTPIDVGPYRLKNRMVMAPLTRLRADAGLVPRAMASLYYSQRASAGLIVTEATDISPQAHGYAYAPGIYTAEQKSAWARVAEAVHRAGGTIFMQIWHTGRMSHPSMQPGGLPPLAPSAIAADGQAATYSGPQDRVVPRAMTDLEIETAIEQFARAAENARQAGFDGVEIHAANGYLIDQFLHDGSNRRDDRWGGTIANRCRFLTCVLDAVTSVMGEQTVGVRLAPSGTHGSMRDSDPRALFLWLADALNAWPLAYLHIVEPRAYGPASEGGPGLGVAQIKPVYRGRLITAGGYDRESGDAVISSGCADMVAFGRLFLANPDLPERFARGFPLNDYDRSTFYGGDERGYTDYPFMDEIAGEVS